MPQKSRKQSIAKQKKHIYCPIRKPPVLDKPKRQNKKRNTSRRSGRSGSSDRVNGFKSGSFDGRRSTQAGTQNNSLNNTRRHSDSIPGQKQSNLNMSEELRQHISLNQTSKTMGSATNLNRHNESQMVPREPHVMSNRTSLYEAFNNQQESQYNVYANNYKS